MLESIDNYRENSESDHINKKTFRFTRNTRI